ncbi:hypothetical protein [Peterkaempfera sp. SMS 1(5)a]
MLDPFTGSGCTGVAALREAGQCVGAELFAYDAEAADRRL